MERWSVEKLKLWREHPYRKPMLLLGARQVGKTWLMQEFGARYYKNDNFYHIDTRYTLYRINHTLKTF